MLFQEDVPVIQGSFLKFPRKLQLIRDAIVGSSAELNMLSHALTPKHSDMFSSSRMSTEKTEKRRWDEESTDVKEQQKKSTGVSFNS